MTEQKWSPSELNFAQDVVKQMNLPAKVTPFDSTLREGEETPGVIMTREDKVRIAQALEELGVKELEIGWPGYFEEHAEAMRAVKKAGISIKIAALIRMWSPDYKKEIDDCVDLGVDILELCGGVSDIQLTKRKWPRGQFMDRMLEATAYAKKTGLIVDFYPFDSVRTDLNFIKSLVKYGVKEGADRVHVSDTVGNATPIATRYFVQEIKKIVGNIPVQYHVHNDFGTAVCSSCAAVEGGAEIVDLVINGMGDRAGNANFQEVVMTLKCLYGVDTGIRTEKLYETCKLVEDLTKFRMEENKPIIGKLCFIHESDDHVQGLLKGHWQAYEPFLPEVVGQKRSIYYGSTTSRDSVVLKAQIMGVELSEAQAETILGKIKEKIEEKGFALEEEVEDFIREI